MTNSVVIDNNKIGEENWGNLLICGFDDNGTLKFANSIKSKQGENRNSSMRLAIDSDQNLFTCNLIEKDIDIDPSVEINNLGFYTLQSERLYIAKYDSNGALKTAKPICSNFNVHLFQYQYNFDVNDYGVSVISDISQGEVVFDFEKDIRINTLFQDAFVAQYSNELKLNYVFTLGVDNLNLWDNTNAIIYENIIKNNGHIIIAGHANGKKDFDPGDDFETFENFKDGPNSFITTYDSTGKLLSIEGFQGIGSHLISNIASNNKNNRIVSGYFDGNIEFDQNTSNHFLDAEISNTFLSNYDGLSTTSIDIGSIVKEEVNLYPNPANQYFIIPERIDGKKPLHYLQMKERKFFQ